MSVGLLRKMHLSQRIFMAALVCVFFIYLLLHLTCHLLLQVLFKLIFRYKKSYAYFGGFSQSAMELLRPLSRIAGPWFAFSILSFAASSVALAWQLVWVRRWTDADSFSPGRETERSFWIGGLVALTLVDGTCHT